MTEINSFIYNSEQHTAAVNFLVYAFPNRKSSIQYIVYISALPSQVCTRLHQCSYIQFFYFIQTSNLVQLIYRDVCGDKSVLEPALNLHAKSFDGTGVIAVVETDESRDVGPAIDGVGGGINTTVVLAAPHDRLLASRPTSLQAFRLLGMVEATILQFTEEHLGGQRQLAAVVALCK